MEIAQLIEIAKALPDPESRAKFATELYQDAKIELYEAASIAGGTPRDFRKRLEILSISIRPLPEIYYFGYMQAGYGHALMHCNGSTAREDCIEGFPWQLHQLDATLCPGYQGPYKTPDQREGSALLHHESEWTALAFWDRSGDRRGMSNNPFIARGEHSAAQLR